MEEKERYEYFFGTNTIKDNKTNQFYGCVVDLLNQQDKRIKELEETNKVLSNELTKNSIVKQDHIETCCGIPIFEIPKIKEENKQLKQQLAEKEKEIEQLKKFDDLNKTFFELFRTAFKEPDKVDDLFNTLKTIQEKQDQDKISFALEQLEKVKRTFIDVAWKDVDFAIEIIDNQIKELKGEK